MNKEYFKYLLSSKRSLLVFLGVINLLFPTLIYFLSLADGWYYNTAMNTVLYSCALVFLECVLLPVIYFSFLHNKKGVDTYFALPISRKEIYITTYIVIILEIVLLHILATLPIVICEWVLGEAVMYIGQYLFYVIACMFVVSSLVLAVCALLLKTNTVVDTFIMIGSYICAPLLVYSTCYVFIDTQAFGVSAHGFLQDFITYAFLPITFVKSYPAFFVNMFEEHDFLFNVDEYKICLMIFACIGVIALLSCVIDMKKRKAEDAEQLSTNLFSYPFIIALATFTLLMDVILSDINFSVGAILVVAIFILFSIMVCIYKRKITFTKKSIILFISTIVLGYGVMFTSSITNAFGLEYSYRHCDTLDNLYLSYDFEIADESFDVNISTDVAEDRIIKNMPHGNYEYMDLIHHLHAKQDNFLDIYKNDELDYERDIDEIYQHMSVQYKKNNAYYYNHSIKINKENIEMMIDEIRFYSQFSFLNVDLNYSIIDENGWNNYKTISLDEFCDKLLKLAETR